MRPNPAYAAAFLIFSVMNPSLGKSADRCGSSTSSTMKPREATPKRPTDRPGFCRLPDLPCEEPEASAIPVGLIPVSKADTARIVNAREPLGRVVGEADAPTLKRRRLSIEGCAPGVEIGAGNETRHIRIVAEFDRAEHPAVARARTLRIGAHSVGAADVHLLRAVEMLRCGLSGQLDHDIRLLAQRLHGRDLGFRLREPTIRAAELRQLLRILRIRRDVARRQNEVIVQGETSLAVAPEAVETSVDAVRMFPAVRQAAEGVHVVLESA